jgi:hypothetical protein
MVPTQGTTITHNKMGADSSALLWEIPPSRPVVVGCIEAKGCTFDGCTFANVGIAGPPDLIKAMREGAT